MMERQGLVRRRVGSGTFLTEDAHDIFGRMDQTDDRHARSSPVLRRDREGRLLFEPAMMHLVVNRVQEHEIDEMRRILGEILDAPTWEDFKESDLRAAPADLRRDQEQVPEQIMASILDDRRAVLFDGRDTKPGQGRVGDAGEDVGEPGLRVDAVELGGADQRVHEGGPVAAALGAGEEPCLAAEGNRAVILPMSGRKLKFVTAGTRSMGDGFAASIRSGAPAARSSTSKRRPAWSSSWPRGCSIRPPASE